MSWRQNIYVREHLHPDCGMLFLCQVRFGEKFCTPFWSTAEQRKTLGDRDWEQCLVQNAEQLLRDHGPAAPLS